MIMTLYFYSAHIFKIMFVMDFETEMGAVFAQLVSSFCNYPPQPCMDDHSDYTLFFTPLLVIFVLALTNISEFTLYSLNDHNFS